MKRFIDCIIPFTACNLRCPYCYITHTKSWGDSLPQFRYTAEQIGRALSVERLGGVSLVNLCGDGETLLPPEVTDILYQILKNGHYVMLVTNGTLSTRMDNIIKMPQDYLKRLLIKFSYHYLELDKREWLDIFFNNVEKARKAGCSISVELTPSDDAIPSIEKILSLCRQRTGAPCHVTVARDESLDNLPLLTRYSRTDYEHIWNVFQSDLFQFKMSVFGEKRREYCYAGLWSGVLNLLTGEFRQCYKGLYLQNIFENPEKPISFLPIGHHCPEPYCYNAHAFLTLGIIPSVPAPTLAQMRNRICDDGSEWLTPEMKDFLNKKLCDENREVSSREKCVYEIMRRYNAGKLKGRQKINSFFQ